MVFLFYRHQDRERAGRSIVIVPGEIGNDVVNTDCEV